MPNQPTITLPRIDGESSRAYAARIEYITAGPNRDLRTIAQKLNKSLTIVGRWSSQYGWVEEAAKYDQTVYTLAAQDASDKYRADLEKHREEAREAGHALYAVSGQLIKAINQALAGPKKIKGEDGKIYTIHNIELNANTFSIAARGMQTALDLKAHALGVDKLLPSLEAEDQSD